MKTLDFSELKKKSYFSIEAGLVSVLSFWTGHKILSLISPNYYFIGGFWCMVCAICILHPCIPSSIVAAKLRFNASILGFAISGICCVSLGYGYLQMLLAVALTVFITRYFKFYSGTRMAATQASIVMVIGIVFPNFTPFLNLTTRLLETLAGLAIGLVALGLSYHFGSRKLQQAKRDEQVELPNEAFN